MIKDMHEMFKIKLNKVDSQNFRNLLVPEIDLLLNEALGIFVKSVAEPRMKNHLGFETSQRSIDDIRPLVKFYQTTVNSSNIALLPADYMFYVVSEVDVKKGNCPYVSANINIRQHDDITKDNAFYESSYEWKEVNARFNSQGLLLEGNSNFTFSNQANGFRMTYIKKPLFIHNAEGYNSISGYNSLSEGTLTGFQNCELPRHTHNEIVDIAVAIASGNLQSPDYQLKLNQLKLNQLT